MLNEEEYGRQRWNQSVTTAGYSGDVNALWDAMVAARQTSGFGLPPDSIAADQTKLSVFCQAVRDHLGGTVPDGAIKQGLLLMPRRCHWCSDDCWEWCDTCGGCARCCEGDYHCIDHGCPAGGCLCPESDYRDSEGKPLPWHDKR